MTKYKLGDICHLEKGKSPIQKTLPGSYPLVVTSEERLTADSFQFQHASVCVPMVSSTGHGHASLKRIHYQEGQYALGNILCAIWSKDEGVLLTKYLYILLSHRKDDMIVPLMKGSTNVALSMRDLKGLEIDVPGIELQEEIVERYEEIVEGYLTDLQIEIRRLIKLETACRSAFLDELLA